MLLRIHAEGQTEEAFVNRILTPHLSAFGYHVICHVNETSRSQKGGLSKYIQFRRHILRHCGSTPCLITTMVDFYQLPHDFPGYDDIHTISNHREKVEYLEEKLKQDLAIKHPHYFIPYIQLHEFEALLFSNIEIIDEVLKTDYGSTIQKLRLIMAEFHEPENINTQKGPSKHLEELTQNTYAKIHDGMSIAEQITLDEMREMCPHFNQWLIQIEKFAKEHIQNI